MSFDSNLIPPEPTEPECNSCGCVECACDEINNMHDDLELSDEYR